MAISTTQKLGLDTPFDYIVVGGGTAGLVVAARLSEDSDVRVLVVEAGADRSTDPLVLTPGLVAAVYGKDEYDWNFSSVPQPHLNNRSINQARGKMLGGSSALNFMMLVYPSRGIIDAWAGLGNKGWDFDSLAPYFRKFGTVHTPPQTARDVVGLTYHNDGLSPESKTPESKTSANNGPVQVSFSEGYGPTNKAWMDAFAAQGFAVSADPREGNAIGAFQNPASIDPVTKTRSFAATAYYTPEVAARPNLVVLTETTVNRILFSAPSSAADEPTATGVELTTRPNETLTVSVVPSGGEVILAAGALHSPAVLEHSGIGSPAVLNPLSIPVLVANPSVGENMQDHPIVCQSFEVADGIPSADALRDPTILAALANLHATQAGAGPLGQSVVSVAYTPVVDGSGRLPAAAVQALFAEHASTALPQPSQQAVRALLSSSADVPAPAFQYLLFPSQITISDTPRSMAEYIVPSEPQNFITIMTVLNHPFSRGSVHIASPSPAALPRWDPRYNSNPLDMELLARGVQFVERLVAPGSPLAGVLKREGGRRLPGIVSDVGEGDLEKSREIVRQRQISVFHVSGSCAMLPREQGGVVDERLRVYGVKGVRVVDASVFPLEPAGNIQSVVYAVAERAADVIKEDRRAGGVNGRVVVM
ncbi:hypothetical protein B0T17DRAFT_648607 [Bombardia bombarda]|uniref:Glucose-methanol-choline oxidoreductase N-terminal domain-containing protein n=1 Tax=Bombardia bombarda TaxID=252184 RepID=A0AA39W4T6_9PEZI|nr:hypothetical protein B0T17DRAFT_648607 [Bombardia bombarda]